MYAAKRRGGNQAGHHDWPLPPTLDIFTDDETDYRSESYKSAAKKDAEQSMLRFDMPDIRHLLPPKLSAPVWGDKVNSGLSGDQDSACTSARSRVLAKRRPGNFSAT